MKDSAHRHKRRGVEYVVLLMPSRRSVSTKVSLDAWTRVALEQPPRSVQGFDQLHTMSLTTVGTQPGSLGHVCTASRRHSDQITQHNMTAQRDDLSVHFARQGNRC